ncbi:amidohydrolase family protein [Cyclobacterium plantarum]|uniref:Amidohydrolase family protein n=1 Tax=Cyclobacterium plantarum TaxID=2716263 RepID=A0ABX0HAY9_9BACT|nr:amidohydrolase family protein [Cyclobacterium plantarum]NHE58827.1 amidohydrolase family protein [Cyclobacterium plantarum]
MKTEWQPTGYILLFIYSFLGMACGSDSNNYTLENYSEVPKMDVHVHIETDRSLFVEKAARDGFRLINVALEYTDGWNDVYQKFDYGRQQEQANPEKLANVTAFAVSNWDSPDWEEKVIHWLDSCFEQGALGVKVWKNIGMVSRDTAGNLIQIDDARFDPIFEHIQKRGKTLMGHLAEPKNCWLPLDEMTTNNDRNYYGNHPEYHMYLQPEMPSHEELIQRRDNMLEKHPNLKFVGAHMGSLEYDVEELARTLDRFPNMAVDLAARMGQVFYQTAEDREKVREFFIRYQDRLLYATDLSDNGSRTEEELYAAMDAAWKRDWEFFVSDNMMESDLINRPFKALQLPKEVVDKVFYENGLKWFGMRD